MVKDIFLVIDVNLENDGNDNEDDYDLNMEVRITTFNKCVSPRG